MRDDKNVTFDGPLAEVCTQFIEYKRSLGYRYGARECYAIKSMDDFFKKYSLNTPCLTPTMVKEYVQKRDGESVQSQKHRMVKIRQLARFLEHLGYTSYILPERQFKFPKTFSPYIFTRDEINALMRAVDQMEYMPRYPKSHLIYPVLMRMLYGCGLRISEALRLTMEHVDIERGVLSVEYSKFGQSRLVPMSNTLIQCCTDYVSQMHFPPKYHGYFFPSSGDGSYKAVSVYARYRYLLEQSGIRHGGRGQGPRLHDLRHTFAVHALESMVEQGFDIYTALPILSTYLGHRTSASTEQYVRLTSAAHAHVTHALEPLYEGLFPEVECDEIL